MAEEYWLFRRGGPEYCKSFGSRAVKDSIARQSEIVEGQIKAVRIPILILGSHRYDGVIDAKRLR